MAGDADFQGLVTAAVTEPISCVADPAQTASVPVMVGAALAVTEAVVLHPKLLV